MVKKDYAKLRDEESERTRAELWIIIAIVVVGDRRRSGVPSGQT